jgi:beta-phosphoglucomutase-like phosphatase (HAD superfamily)
MHIQLAVVDLACLVDGLGDTCARLLRLAARDVDILVSEEDAQAVLGLPIHRAITALCQTGLDLASVAERSERAHDLFATLLVEEYARGRAVREKEGASDLLASLRVLGGVGIALASNLPSLAVGTILASIDWHDRGLVDTVVTCEDVLEPRPRPGMIHEAMARTACSQPLRVMTLGDTPACLAEGTLARAGLVVGSTGGLFTRGELELRPHTHLVDRLVDVVHLARRAPSAPATLRVPRAIWP